MFRSQRYWNLNVSDGMIGSLTFYISAPQLHDKTKKQKQKQKNKNLHVKDLYSGQIWFGTFQNKCVYIFMF